MIPLEQRYTMAPYLPPLDVLRMGLLLHTTTGGRRVNVLFLAFDRVLV